jgi:acyl dehydratase
MWFEDMDLGAKRDLGSYTISLEEIMEFAWKYDPQPFHIDAEAAAKSMFGGIIASGWHTAALWMKRVIESAHGDEASDGIVSPGFEAMRWHKPVRPGMTLNFSTEVIEKVELKSRSDLGLVKQKNEAHDEAGTLVFSFIGKAFVPRKPKATAL